MGSETALCPTLMLHLGVFDKGLQYSHLCNYVHAMVLIANLSLT